MASVPLRSVLRQIQKAAGAPPPGDRTDAQLLTAFVATGEAAAFEVLVRRHGPMVLSVCRRVLHHGQDAEDAFQATFLLLARKAGAIRKPESVGSWLYGVAYRIARKARAEAARRSARERRAAELRPTSPGFDAAWRGLQAVLDEELNGMPEPYRLPLILCYLEGLTHEEAARQLGCPPGTVKSRLARGRARLRGRLARRGLGLAAVPFAAVLAAQTASALPHPLLRAAVGFAAAGRATASARVVSLAEGARRAILLAKTKAAAAVLLALSALAAGAGLLTHTATDQPPTGKPREPGETSTLSPARLAGPPPNDRYGDPLPEGAIARLGTLRFRHGGGTIDRLLVSRDGKTLISKTYYGNRTVCAWDLATGKLLHQFPGHYEENGAAALSPDGKTLAIGHDRRVRFWDVASGREVRRLEMPLAGVQGLAVSPDGRMLASGHEQKTVLLWDLAAGTVVGRLRAEHNRLTRLTFTSDGKTLVTGDSLDRTVRLFDVAARKERHQLTRPNFVRGIALSPNGSVLAVGAQEGVASIWDVQTGRLVHELHGAPFVAGLAFSPDGKTLASAEYDQKADRDSLALWDVATGKELHRVVNKTGPAWSLAFSADGKTVIAGSGGTIRLWDPATGEERGPAPGNPGYVGWVAAAAHGRILAYTADASVRLWDVIAERDVGRLPGQHWSVTLSPDGRLLAGGTELNQVNLWDVGSQRRVRRLESDPKKAGYEWVAYYHVAFSPDGKRLASAGRGLLPGRGVDEVVQLWDVATGRELRRFSLKERASQFGTVEAVAFSPDGRTLVASGRSQTDGSKVCLWDLATGRALTRAAAGLNHPFDPGPGNLSFPQGPIIMPRIAVSPDGRLLSMNRWQNSVPVWEAATGRERLRLEGHRASTVCVAFAPDSRTLASAGLDDTIRLWDLATGRELRRFTGHRAAVNSLAFTADGRRLISASDDATLLVWDVAAVTGRARRTARLTPAEWETAWSDLAGADAARAQLAITRLTAGGPITVENLKDRLAPATPADPARLTRLLGDLDSTTFALREKAAQELERLGDQARPAVEEALARPGLSLEPRRRLEQLRDRLTLPSGDELRGVRAVEVLERIGTPEAHQMIDALSHGSPEARLTREAAAARARLAAQAKGE